MYCTNCGAKNDDGAKFCIECGEKLASDSNITDIAPNAKDTISGTIEDDSLSNIQVSDEAKVFNFKCFKYFGRFLKKPINTTVTVKNGCMETVIDTKVKLMNKSKFNQRVFLSDIEKINFVQASTFSLRDVIGCTIFVLRFLMGLFAGGDFFAELAASFIVGLPLLYWLSLSPAIEIVKKDKTKLHIFALPKENKQTMLELKSILTKEEIEDSDKIKIPFNKKTLLIALVCVVITFFAAAFSGSSDDVKIDNIRNSHFATHEEYTVGELFERRYSEAGDNPVEWCILVDPNGNEYVAVKVYAKYEEEKIHVCTMLFSPVNDAVNKVYALYLGEDIEGSNRPLEYDEVWYFIEEIYRYSYESDNGVNSYDWPVKANMNALIVVPKDYAGDETQLYQLDSEISQAQIQADTEYRQYLDELNSQVDSSDNFLTYTNITSDLDPQYYPTIYIYDDGTFYFDINQLSHMRYVTGTWSIIYEDTDFISLYFDIDSEYQNKNSRFRMYSDDGGLTFSFDGCGENYGSLMISDNTFYLSY